MIIPSQRWMGETSAYFLADGEQTGEQFALVEERAVHGESVPLHLHREDAESFYVLEGEIMLFVDEQPGARAGAGAFAHIPGGTVHGFRIVSETARYLIMTTPRHARFYREILRVEIVWVDIRRPHDVSKEHGAERRSVWAGHANHPRRSRRAGQTGGQADHAAFVR